MAFDHPLLLALLALPLAWWGWERRRTRRRVALKLKAAAFAALTLALAQPRILWLESRVALAVLVDTSASVSANDLARASGLAAAIEKERGRNWMRVIPFARSTRDAAAGEQASPWRFQPTAGERGRSTDLESAIREAISALPANRNPRIALVSDGRENEGSVARAAWQARQLGVPVDTYLLAGRPKPELMLESLRMPANTFAGEPFSIDLELSASRALPAQVELKAEGRTLGAVTVSLASGTNPVHLRANLDTPGLTELAVSIRSQTAREASGAADDIRFGQSIMVRRAKALYITGDSPFLDSHLPQALKAAQFDVTRIGEIRDVDVSGYQLIVFNNWEMNKVPAVMKERIERYVRDGGGLLVVGGERNVYVANNAPEDPLERVLPAKLLPPRTTEGRAVILIIDRSTSMLGPKIEFARIAAAGVVSNLRPIDIVGVLVFDTSFLWQVQPRLADDRDGINWLISQITPNGGTRIPQALAEGYRGILDLPAIYKHILLLTDGLSEEGSSMNLAREAQNNAITISTVGLGRDVNRRYLQRLASTAGGKSYFVDEPEALEQIVISDVMEHTGSTTAENVFAPKVVRSAEILEGVGIAKAPTLKGYVRYETKPAADTILRAEARDPLLARWQYGLGRAAVFTSDAKPRWAVDWIGWKGYDRFWANIARDLLPRRDPQEATLTYDSATGDLVASYPMLAATPARAASSVSQTGGKPIATKESGVANARAATPSSAITPPQIFVLSEKFQAEMPLRVAGAGQFTGRLHIGDRPGFFRVRPLEDSVFFPEMGLYRPEAELSDYGANEPLMRQVSRYTGGRFQPDPKNAFSNDGRTIPITRELSPALVALAMALSLTELVMRKRSDVKMRRE
jgi:Ca-activated chloride channel family protein